MGERVPELNEQDEWGRTGLHNAVMQAGYGGIATILQRGPNRNIQDHRGKTPLHLATFLNRIEPVKQLLESPGAAKVDIQDIDQRHALHIAADEGYEMVSQKLLDCEANPNAQDKYNQTPLHIAATKGYVRIVEQLIGKGVKPNLTDKKGRTALHWAAENGFDAIVEELLGSGKANIDALEEERRTPLHLAAIQGRERVIEVLLNHKIGMKDALDRYGQPPIYYSALYAHEGATKILKNAKAKLEIENGSSQTLLYQFASLGNLNAVKLLIDDPPRADINARDIHENPPLYAAAKGNHSAIVRHLVSAGADKEAVDEKGQSILHRAAKEGSEVAVRELLKIEPEKDAMDNEGQTPLYVAARYNHRGVVKLLANDNRPRLDAKDSTGRTLLHRAAFEGHAEAANLLAGEKANLELLDSNGRCPLYIAAISNREDIFRNLCKEHKANTERRDANGQTLLHRAAREGNPTAVKQLLKVDANKKAKDNNGQTAFHVAVHHSEEVVKVLIRYEADINMKDNDGRTPLHTIVSKGDSAINMMKLLVAHRAKPVTTDNNGKTPLHAAAAKGDVNMVSKLLDIPAVKESMNKQDNDGNTAMHDAAQFGHHEVVHMLYRDGASKDLLNVDGWTPLHTAANYGKSQVVGIIRGLSGWEANRAMKDKKKQTPFHLACLSRDQATIDMFVDPTKYSVPPPRTTQQYHVHYRHFVSDNLPGIYSPGDPRVRDFAAKAAAKASDAARMWGLDESDVPGLALLWLYDLVILCDDSNSMKKNPERIETLNETLERAVSIANVITDDGIYVRFLNYHHDQSGGFDNMTGAQRIVTKVKEAYNRRDVDIYTPLGTELMRKIVKPLVVDKIDNGRFNKPLIVFTITDGCPEKDTASPFDATIRSCKEALRQRNMGSASVIFLVSQVGNSPDATKFLNSLQHPSSDIRQMLYCAKGDLDKILAGYIRKSSEKYTGWLVKSLVEALKTQSVSRYN